MNYADVEKGIAALGQKAKNNQIAVEDMDGGTFTISNGGVFGSLFGTPIINPPQSSILGMHGVFERPVVRNGQVRYVKYKNNNTNIRVLKNRRLFRERPELKEWSKKLFQYEPKYAFTCTSYVPKIQTAWLA